MAAAEGDNTSAGKILETIGALLNGLRNVVGKLRCHVVGE